jgi:HNH endonuclease
VHHIVAWKPGGRTDLDNLALTCLHHHHLVHSNQGWAVSGNANEELTFVGPTGRVMTSRPSPLWTRVTAGPRSGRSG